MALSYKNQGSDPVLSEIKNINDAISSQANGPFLSQYCDVELTHEVDIMHLSSQADIWSRAMISEKGVFSYKRFLGSEESDWQRLLHVTFIYSYTKCLYYGYKNAKIDELNEKGLAFPGHVLMIHQIAGQFHKYEYLHKGNMYMATVTIRCGNLEDMLESIFVQYPELRSGFGVSENIPHYMNAPFESILSGLESMKSYHSRGGRTQAPFEIVKMDEVKIRSFIVKESNPLINGFLSKDGRKFFFKNPTLSSINLDYNESLYLSRALGFRNNTGIIFQGNQLYAQVPRVPEADPLIRFDVFATTGLKTPYTPMSQAETLKCLGDPYSSNWSNLITYPPAP